MIRYTLAGVVVIVLGLLLGLHPEAGIGGVILSLGMVLIFAFSLSWVWTMLGLLMDDPESVAMISSLTTFPLTFISNVFVNPSTMPQGLRSLAEVNPISLTTTAVRGLMSGDVTGMQLATAFLACGILMMIFAPLTMYLYNHKVGFTHPY
jgi:ABC-2 type transport system permease protein